MLNSYMTYDGIELSNAARTITYARNLGIGSVKAEACDCDSIPDALGDTYDVPMRDDAPWYDSRNMDTAGFCGLLVTNVNGGESSSHTAYVTETVGDGGVVSPPRHATKPLVITGLLIGVDHASTMAGLSWLESFLHDGDPCTVNRLPNEHPILEFFSACPVICEDSDDCELECVDPYWRRMYDVHLTSGPEQIAHYDVSDGCVLEIQFVLVSHNPYVWGRPESVSASPYPFTYEILPEQFADYAEMEASATSYQALYQELWELYIGDQWGSPGESASPPTYDLPDSFFDPDCDPLPAFPTAAQENAYCRDLPTSWQRAAFLVGRDDVPEWSPSIPTLTLSADAEDHKDIRIRFTPGTGDPDTDYEREWLLRWLPAGGVLVMDGARNRIDLTVDGVTARAAHLIESTIEGQPFEFPLVGCDQPYTISIDMRSEETSSDLTLGLALSLREY